MIAEADPRRLAVLNAAAQLALELGVDGTTSRAIADRAGTSVASLYRMFPDKESVLRAALVTQLGELASWQRDRLAGASNDPAAMLGALFDGYVAWCGRRPDYRALWFTGEGGAALQEVRWTSTRRLIEICTAKLAHAAVHGTDEAALLSNVIVVVTAADRAVGASYRYPTNRRLLVDEGRAGLLRYVEATASR